MNQRRRLILLPGLDGSGKLFSPIIPHLEAHFDVSIVTFPDLPSFNDYVDTARNQLPDSAGITLVAESLAGPVALALMAQRAGQFGPSILSSTFARSPLAALTHLAKHIPEQMFSIGALSEFCLDIDAEENVDFSETQPLPLNVTDQIDGAVLKHRLSVMSRIDVSAVLPQIDVPMLCLHAERDRILSETDVQMLQKYLPRATRINIDGPHLLLQTRPQECADLIVRHVEINS